MRKNVLTMWLALAVMSVGLATAQYTGHFVGGACDHQDDTIKSGGVAVATGCFRLYWCTSDTEDWIQGGVRVYTPKFKCPSGVTAHKSSLSLINSGSTFHLNGSIYSANSGLFPYLQRGNHPCGSGTGYIIPDAENHLLNQAYCAMQ